MQKPKKKFGQHYLLDPSIAEDIVSHADLHPQDIVWEIGPGLGALTDLLIKATNNLHIIEIDKDLIPVLSQKYAVHCQIVNKDILKINWTDEIKDHKIKIVSNLPYQISSPFLYKLTEYVGYIDCVVVMLQKEVAKRLCAKPRSKDYGVLTIKTRFYYDAFYLFDVPPEKFSPPPNVQSAVIKLVPRADVPVLENPASFWGLVERCFVSRRKTLRNNLKSYNIDLSQISIDLSRRSETLSEREFLRLYEEMVEIRINTVDPPCSQLPF